MSTPNKSRVKHLAIGFLLTAGAGYWEFSRYQTIPVYLEWSDIIAILAFLTGATLLIASTPGEEYNFDEKSPF